MRYGIFSDAHGNIETIDAMFQKMKDYNIDSYIFCGDIIGYFHHGEEVIQRLCKNQVLCVKGNHDDYYLQGLSDANIREKLTDCYGSSYQKVLQEEQIQWLRKLPLKISISDSYASLLILHGRTDDALEGRLYPDTQIKEEYVDRNYSYIIMGHTHYRMNRTYKNITLLNPGSIGQPRDNGGFSFLVLDTRTGEINFDTVSVDIGKLNRSVTENEIASTRNREYLLKRMENMQ